MTWLGQWRNQYGSILEITSESGQRLSGKFRSALKDSSFYEDEADVVGIYRGDCVSFAMATTAASGDSIAAFTGLLRDGKLQTVWHVVTDGIKLGDRIEKRSWSHAVTTNADTFVRVL
jgi:hypothetical protein